MAMRIFVFALCALASAGHAGAAPSSLENPPPNAKVTGIGVISGWACQATNISIQFDSGALLAVPYGSQRGDTAGVCGGRIDTGFSYLFNFNTLSAGTHTLRAFADGVQFAAQTIDVVKLGGEFLTGKSGEYHLQNFPELGARSVVTWIEGKQNFEITALDSQMPSPSGTYHGAVRYTNTGCYDTSLNGSSIDHDTFGVQQLASGGLVITLTGPSSCTYIANEVTRSAIDGYLRVPSGTFACFGGIQGTWQASRIVVDVSGIIVEFTSTVTAGETCRQTGRIGAVRG